jgi:hypothetical protein
MAAKASLDPPEATNKRSRDAEGEAEDGEAASLLSSIQIALFLNGRKDLKKPVANDELRKYLKSEHNVTHKIPKAALKSTLKYLLSLFEPPFTNLISTPSIICVMEVVNNSKQIPKFTGK